MNKAILVGNLTRDPEQRTTQNGVSVTSFTIAAQRRFKNEKGEYEADFINCVAWRGTAEFIAKYFGKGSKIGVVGSIQTRTYDDKNGVRRYVTEVNVEEAEFVTSKADNPARAGGEDTYQTQSQSADDLFAEGLREFEPLDDDGLPF